MALELTLAVQQGLNERLDEADRLRHRRVERALSLATDFPAIWQDPDTPHRERQLMLGLLIEDVSLIKQRQITAAVRFGGGATTILTLPRPLTAPQRRATRQDVRQQIDALLDEYTDAQVAHRLNQRGLHTGAGRPFDTVSVKWVRHAHKLKSSKQRLLEEGWLTGRQTQERLGVKRTTLSRWRKTGQIKARICTDLGEWLYWLPAEAEDHLTSSTPTPKDTSTAGDAV